MTLGDGQGTAAGWRYVPWVLLATALLSLVVLINGFPLVFPDSGTYLRQAMRLEGILDRPPFYSLFLLPIHMGRSLWPIPVVQDAIVAVFLFRTFALALPFAGSRAVTAAVALACLCTSLPWYSNQIMPDIFTPLIVLAIYGLVLGWDRLARVERYVLPAALLAMLLVHTSNPAFGCIVGAVAAGLAWAGGAGRVAVLRRAGLVAAMVAVAIAGQSLYGYEVIGRVTPAPAAPFFTLARLIYDGPARLYLADACPGAGYFLCAHQSDFHGDSDWFLWQPDSPLQALIAARHERAALDEAASIVRHTVVDHPGAVMIDALRNSGRQFLSVATLITSCPCLGGKIGRVVPELFAGEAGQYRGSLQNRDLVPWRVLTAIDGTALGVAVAVLVLVALRRPGWLRGEPGRLLLLIMAALCVNASLMGSLSGVTDRYQARLVWLVPVFAMVLVFGRLGRSPISDEGPGRNGSFPPVSS